MEPGTRYTAVAAGLGHGLALTRDGTVVSWGQAHDGETIVRSNGTVVAWGRNDYGQATVPAGLTNVTAISAGLYHGVALRSDGTVVAWGNNSRGQTNVPAGLSGVVAVSAGWWHTLALKRPSARNRLEVPQFTNNGIRFTLAGEVGVNYRIDVSSDLSNWTPVTNFTSTQPVHHFNDSPATNHARRFFRAVAP